MPAFTAPTDIGNRALQHCGAARMDPTLGFNEGGINASETSFAYDKLREAELRSNLWTFAIKKVALRAIDTNTMRMEPALWSSTTTYFRGSVVQDQSQNWWISDIPANLNNDPLQTTYWKPYFGPVTVPLWDSTGTTAYYSGEVVYTTPGDGTGKVYLSLIDGNSDNPATASSWDATVTYAQDDVITRTSVAYKSLIDLNLNQDPASAPALWAVGTTYAAGNKVGGSDGVIYQSIGSGNVGIDPTTDGGVHWTNTGALNPWTTVIGGGTGSVNWLEIGGSDFPSGVSLTEYRPSYPIGSGPFSQSQTRNVFHLPNSFIRPAPQLPKTATPYLGGPSGLVFTDWTYENEFIVTFDAGPIIYRFVADVTNVRRMDAMFCEALSARIGLAICQKVTQSTGKLQTIAQEYSKWIGQAKLIDAIEQDYTDQPDDDFVSVRY